MIIGVDATALSKNRTGVGNYIYEILLRLTQKSDWKFILYSNQDIFFQEGKNITLKIHTPYRKGAAWVNTQLRKNVIADGVDVFWAGNGYLPLGLPQKTFSIVTVHDLVYRHAGSTMPFVSRWARKLLQPLAAKSATKLVAVSEATKTEILGFYGIKPDAVINPQISTEFNLSARNYIQQVTAELGLPERYLLVLGTLEPRKNLFALVNAYIKCRQNGLALPTLYIAGGKGWLEGKLPELIADGERLGVVKKLGFVKNEFMKGLYAGAEAFIFPSLHEGFGMPVLEAQLCGTPVLISDIPSLKEASGDIACRFEPSEAGISDMFQKYAGKDLPLVCRLHNTIKNNPDAAAATMQRLIEDVMQIGQ